MTKRTLALLGGVGAAAVVAVAGIAITQRDAPASVAPIGVVNAFAAESTASSDDRGSLGAQMRELMANEAFRQDAAGLRDDFQEKMEAWWDKYGEEPRGDEALTALEQLRDEQHEAMSALLEKYGVDTSSGSAAREAAEAARDKLEDLMSDSAFRADVNELRDTHEKAMDAWWDKYASSPRGSEALAALEKIRDAAKDDIEALLKEYDIELPAEGHGVLGLLGGETMMGRGMAGAGLMGRADGDGLLMGRGGFGGHGGMHDRVPAASQSPAATQTF